MYKSQAVVGLKVQVEPYCSGLYSKKKGVIVPFDEIHWRKIPGMYSDPDPRKEVLIKTEKGEYFFMFVNRLEFLKEATP